MSLSQIHEAPFIMSKITQSFHECSVVQWKFCTRFSFIYFLFDFFQFTNGYNFVVQFVPVPIDHNLFCVLGSNSVSLSSKISLVNGLNPGVSVVCLVWSEHHLQTNHRINWDSAEYIIYSPGYYQRLTLESWFTKLEKTPLNRCHQLPGLTNDELPTPRQTNNRLNRQFD